jgi:hypothetical protein
MKKQKSKANKINLNVEELKQLKKVLIGRRRRKKTAGQYKKNIPQSYKDGLSAKDKSYVESINNPVISSGITNALLVRQLQQPFSNRITNEPFQQQKNPALLELENKVSGLTKVGGNFLTNLDTRVKQLEFSSLRNDDIGSDIITREDDPIGIESKYLTPEPDIERPKLMKENTAEFNYDNFGIESDNNSIVENPIYETPVPRKMKNEQNRQIEREKYYNLVRELKPLGYDELDKYKVNIDTTTNKQTITKRIRDLEKIKKELLLKKAIPKKRKIRIIRNNENL